VTTTGHNEKGSTPCANTRKKPKAKYQGKVVVEVCYGGYFFMLPDGQVGERQTQAEVEKLAKAWFKKHAPRNAVGVGVIEWRARDKTVKTKIEQPFSSSTGSNQE
jgi:hypothetical protein